MTGDTSCHFAVINYIITYPPLYFVRSGTVYSNIGRLGIAGYNGYNWLSSTTSKIWNNAGLGAYCLHFSATNTHLPEGPLDRWSGFPLRGLGSGGGDQQIAHLVHLSDRHHQV